MSLPIDQWPGRDKKLPDHGYVYVIAFSSGAVKVGHTTNPAQRMKCLRLDAGRFGLHVTRVWLSAFHAGHADNEVALIHEAKGLGDQLASEFFVCDFIALVAFASTLDFARAPRPVVPSRSVARVQERRAEVRRLRDEGYSIREIGRALDLSVGTVHGDVASG